MDFSFYSKNDTFDFYIYKIHIFEFTFTKQNPNKMKKIYFILIFALGIHMSNAQCPLSTAVDFTVTTVEGNSFNLFNTLAENKFVVIDFFYYGCVPCQQTAPKVNGAYEAFGCNSGNVIFIGIDNGDNTATTILFGENFGANYPAASGTDGGADAVVTAYGITAFPTVIMIAPDHSIIEQDIWPIADAAALTTVVQANGGNLKACPTTAIAQNTINQLTVYPNPANDHLIIKLPAETTNKTIHIAIYDMLGNIISQKNIQESNSQVEMNVASIESGLYIIRLENINGIVDQTTINIVH